MALDRKGICTAFADMLKADTTTLFGTNKLLQTIESTGTKFDKAKVNIKSPFGLYIWCEDKIPIDERMQNSDDLYILNFRYEGRASVRETAIENIDDADEQVTKLARAQMFEGQQLTGYYTDSNAQVIDVAPSTSSLPAPEEREDNMVIIENEAALEIQVNRWT